MSESGQMDEIQMVCFDIRAFCMNDHFKQDWTHSAACKTQEHFLGQDQLTVGVSAV